MKKFSSFATSHPILFGFILILLFTLLSTLTWPITQIYPTPDGYEVGTALSKLVITACFILLLWGFGWLKSAGFTSLGDRRIWLLAVGILVYKAILSVYAFSGSFEFSLPTAGLTTAILFYTLATSLLEETMYRGLLLTAMVKAWGHTRQGLFVAAILSGFFWASLHFFNLLVRPFPLVASQVFEIAMVGFVYAALVLSGRSIWPAVIIHWSTNATMGLRVVQIPDFTETIAAWGISSLVTLPLVAMGVYLLMRLNTANKVNEQEIVSTRALDKVQG